MRTPKPMHRFNLYSGPSSDTKPGTTWAGAICFWRAGLPRGRWCDARQGSRSPSNNRFNRLAKAINGACQLNMLPKPGTMRCQLQRKIRINLLQFRLRVNSKFGNTETTTELSSAKNVRCGAGAMLVTFDGPASSDKSDCFCEQDEQRLQQGPHGVKFHQIGRSWIDCKATRSVARKINRKRSWIRECGGKIAISACGFVVQRRL